MATKNSIFPAPSEHDGEQHDFSIASDHNDTEQADEKAADDLEQYPEGGMRAWLVAAGAAGVVFSTMGYSNSFGVFQEYYAEHQLLGDTPDKIAWIGSVQSFLMFAAGSIGGPLFDRYGAWVSIAGFQLIKQRSAWLTT
jgi:hypothetical protein